MDDCRYIDFSDLLVNFLRRRDADEMRLARKRTHADACEIRERGRRTDGALLSHYATTTRPRVRVVLSFGYVQTNRPLPALVSCAYLVDVISHFSLHVRSLSFYTFAFGRVVYRDYPRSSPSAVISVRRIAMKKCDVRVGQEATCNSRNRD